MRVSEILVGKIAAVRVYFVNFTAFSLVQFASYLIPMVTIPYFARVLTVAGMGHIAVAGAVALAGSVLMDYGILQSGARFAAKNTANAAALSEYLVATSLLKLASFAVLLAMFALASLTIQGVSDHFWVYFWSLISAGAMCLFPQWLFQGLLIIPAAAKILVLTRVLAALLAMALIQSPADTFVVPMTQAVAGMIALGAAAVFFRRRFGIEFKWAGRAHVEAILRDNWKLFSATAWGAVHTYGSIIILGAMLPPRLVGFYSIAERISQALVSLFNIAAQTCFPSFARRYARNDISFRRRTFAYVLSAAIISAAALSVVFIFRYPIYEFFSGERDGTGVTIFSIWIFASFFTVVCVSLSPIMVAMHLDAKLANIYRFTGIIFLLSAPVAVYKFGAVGMAVAALFPQCFMAIYLVLVVRRALERPSGGGD